MVHTCSRDDCPRENANGPKANCFQCKKLCFFVCYGETTLNQLAAMSDNGRKNDHFFGPTSNIQFICTDCLSPSTSGQSLMNDSMTTPKADKITIRSIMSEVAKLHDNFANLQLSSDAMNKKLDSIEIKANDIKSTTDAALIKIDLQQTNNNGNVPVIFGSSAAATRPFRPQLGRTTPSVAALSGTSTPTSSKRRRTGTGITPSTIQPAKKRNFPAPQMGTNTNAGKLVAVEIRAQKKPMEKKSTFEKALWVSRLNPSVTEEDVRDYITTNTTASSNFTVRKLVKNGQDLSQLTFVSFKVDLSADDFAILNTEDAWPVNVAVRPFDEAAKPKAVTLGDFLSKNLNGQQTRTSPTKLNETNEMVVVEDSPKGPNAS